MSSQELMRPRYKVIADYPNSPFAVNDILLRYEFETSETGMYIYVTNIVSPLQGNSCKYEFVESMPHLFKKMEWWQERKEDEMPMYLKSINTGAVNVGRIDFKYEIYFINESTAPCYFKELGNVIPATEQQYTDYINSLTK